MLHTGYFPIIYSNEKAVETQIAVGVSTYKKYLGRNPKGIWLPECGYIPESDKYLKKYGRQVWSSITGYPGDPNFRDFYKDIGYDAPYEYIKPYIAKNGVRVHTGIKYHSITRKNF